MIEWFVKNYSDDDFYLRKKAEYSFKFIITMIVAISAILSSDMVFGSHEPIIIISGFIAIFMFGVCLWLIHVTKYEAGINLMIGLGIIRLVMLFNYEITYQYYAMIAMVLMAVNVVNNKNYQVLLIDMVICIALVSQCYRTYIRATIGAVPIEAFYETVLSIFLYFAVIYFVGYVRGIIDREISENEKLMAIAERDPLTNLYNRRKITERFNSLLEAGKELKVILFDIDDFKNVNDTYGHNIGDDVLVEVAQLIKGGSSNNELVAFARWGGEEFLMLTESSDEVAESMRALVDSNQFSNDIKLTISVGQTTTLSVDTITSAVKRADEAMYISKKTGKNKVTNL